MIIPRKLVREYLKDLITDAVGDDVGGRVYVGRPNPTTREELPFVLILPLSESISPLGGNQQVPQDYLREITATLLVVVEQPNDYTQSESAEDRLDTLGRRVEKAMREDKRFQKRLPTWTGNISDTGVIAGSRIDSVTVDLESESESSIAAMQLVYMLWYEDDSENEKRERAFESYLIELRRVGWDESTVDPVLIAAEGDIDA